MVSVLSFIAEHDADLLPAFVRHYRQLGVQRMRFCLHGPWPAEPQRWLRAQPDCEIHSQIAGPFSEALKCRQLTAMAHELPGSWVITVDADEFLALPAATVRRTIAGLQIMGVTALPCWLVQRHAADGSLAALPAHAAPDAVFPLMQFGLSEALGVETPIWKEKFSLAFVTDRFAVQRGFHFPPNAEPCEHVPVRGVVHHFKWRAGLRNSLSKPRDIEANGHEQQAYAQWLRTHDWTLPVAGAVPCSRQALLAAGLLVWPDRAQRQALAMRRKLAGADNDVARTALAERLAATVSNPAGLAPAQLREGLIEAPGKIALVSFELFDGGGIATAIGVTANVLAAGGHEVHILYCPFNGDHQLWAGHHEQWAARGVSLHYLPRMRPDDSAYPNNYLMSKRVADRLAAIAADVIHFVDAEAYGMAVVLQRLGGYRFTGTAVLAAYHGPNEWHYMSGEQAVTINDHEGRHALAAQARHADWHCAPSRYLRDWICRHYEVDARRFVAIANPLGGAARVGGNPATQDAALALPTPVTELVFFGRLSKRKGLATFLRAVAHVREQHKAPFQITLLGMPDAMTDMETLRAAPALAGLPLQWLRNYSSTDALNYLRTHVCVAVVPSLADNSPYTVYETLANAIALITTDVGGIRELVDPLDHPRLCPADDDQALASRLQEALTAGIRPMRLAFDWLARDVECLALHGQAVREARRRRRQAAAVASPGTDQFEYGRRALETPAPVLAAMARSKQPRHLLRACYSTFTDADALGHMQALMNATDADVVISDSLVVQRLADGDNEALAERCWVLPAPAGPAAIIAVRHVMGAGCMLLQHRALDLWTDFAPGVLPTLWWQRAMLNHLVARGGKVVGLPAPLTRLVLQGGDAGEARATEALSINPGQALQAALQQAQMGSTTALAGAETPDPVLATLTGHWQSLRRQTGRSGARRRSGSGRLMKRLARTLRLR